MPNRRTVVLLGCAAAIAWLYVAYTSLAEPSAPSKPLRQLRSGFKTKVFYDQVSRDPAPEPPAKLFELVRYRAPLGEHPAYVSRTTEGGRHPAIVWIVGGFDWGIGEVAWAESPRANDQSARAFREAGIVLMMPSLRGSSGSPGRNECFLGEVEDIVAAANYLATRPDVDPKRIYLGGHSTGGTLVLLVAASSDRFRAVFSFGAVDDPASYGSDGCLPTGVVDDERVVRAPIHFAAEIRSPTWLIEGANQRFNAADLQRLYDVRQSAPLRLVLVPGLDHFSVLAPGTETIAAAILADRGAEPALSIDAKAILARLQPSKRRSSSGSPSGGTDREHAK